MTNKLLSKRFIIIELVVLLLVLIGLYFSGYFTNEELNGNDRESIIQTIHSIEMYKEQPVNLLEVKDIDDQRVVSFLSGTSPAYILFEKREGDYKWYSSGLDRKGDFEQFYPAPRDVPPKILFIKNGQSDVARWEVEINGKEVHQDFTPNKPSVTWFDFPDTNESSYTFRDYKYYDENGQLIEKPDSE